MSKERDEFINVVEFAFKPALGLLNKQAPSLHLEEARTELLSAVRKLCIAMITTKNIEQEQKNKEKKS